MASCLLFGMPTSSAFGKHLRSAAPAKVHSGRVSPPTVDEHRRSDGFHHVAGDGLRRHVLYGAAGGQRLTLYVTREVAGQDAAFKFGQDGPVNVFYWVDDQFGYAISAGADRDELMKVSQEVYKQLKRR